MSRSREELQRVLESHQERLLSLGVSKESAEVLCSLARKDLEPEIEPNHSFENLG